jgi:hypothetical protein
MTDASDVWGKVGVSDDPSMSNDHEAVLFVGAYGLDQSGKAR